MLNNRLLSHRTAASSTRGGFTLVELLVVISIIAILASVALGPIMRGIKQAQHSSALQTSRSIALLEFQYANDNGNVFPDGPTAHDIANLLLNTKYATDPKLFGITGTPGYSLPGNPGTGGSWTLSAGNVTWNFMGVNNTNNNNNTTPTGPYGLTSSAADGTPVVWTQGGDLTTISTSGATALKITVANNPPFSTDGVAVTYKGNNATWLPADITGNVANFIDSSYNDPLASNYIARKN